MTLLMAVLLDFLWVDFEEIEERFLNLLRTVLFDFLNGLSLDLWSVVLVLWSEDL